jgi:hypothetical protein
VVVEVVTVAEVLQGVEGPCGVRLEGGAVLRGDGVEVGGGACCVDVGFTPSGGLKL